MIPPRVVDALFAAFNAVSAFVLALGVFWGLPSREVSVDGAAIVILVAFGLASLGLWAPASRSLRAVSRIAMASVLALGALLVLLLFFSAGHLYGIYGPIGRGGAILFVLVVALALPYLVIFPALQLIWLMRRPDR